MKLLKKEFEKNGGGSMRVTPENSEDMWHIFNLIAKGDHVTATSFRKVQRETGAGAPPPCPPRNRAASPRPPLRHARACGPRSRRRRRRTPHDAAWPLGATP